MQTDRRMQKCSTCVCVCGGWRRCSGLAITWSWNTFICLSFFINSNQFYSYSFHNNGLCHYTLEQRCNGFYLNLSLKHKPSLIGGFAHQLSGYIRLHSRPAAGSCCGCLCSRCTGSVCTLHQWGHSTNVGKRLYTDRPQGALCRDLEIAEKMQQHLEYTPIKSA